MSQAPEYFIGLQNTVVIRKGLLEAAKGSVTVLKSHYRLREVRAEKRAYMQQITQHLSEVSTLVDSLDQDLPTHDRDQMPEAVRRAAPRLAEQHPEPEPQKAPRPAPAPKPKPTPPKSKKRSRDAENELRALEAKLSDIESKLNKL